MIDFTIFDKQGRILKSGKASGSQINYQFDEGYFVLCEPSDPETQRVVDGDVVDLPARPGAHHDFDYERACWVIDKSRAWKAIRAMRDELISGSDWRVARAIEQGELLGEQWKTYRQALRDITLQNDPGNIQWPTAPEEEK